MKLTDLDPLWLMKDGKRIGFTFVSPINPKWRQSCFTTPIDRREQMDLFDQQGCLNTQGSNPKCKWVVKDGIEAADFSTITVNPSLDGSKGGLWHGFITNGEIVGGI